MLRRVCVGGSLSVMLWLALGQEGAAQSWTSIGPMPISALGALTASRNFKTGRVTSVAVDPAGPGHWLIGAATGGIWETRDSGTTWTPRTESQPSFAFGAVVFAPSNRNVVYAGTGKANFGRDAYAGQGVLKSTDGGRA